MKLKFKSTITGATIAACVTLAAPACAANDNTGGNEQYLGAQLAIADVSNNVPLGNGLTFVGTYGLSLPKVQKYFGLEAEVTKSITHPDYDTPLNHTEFDYYTVAGYAVMTIPIREKISLRARAGLLHEKWEQRDRFSKRAHTHNDFSIGGGAIYKLNSGINLIAEITIIESNIIHASTGVQFKF